MNIGKISILFVWVLFMLTGVFALMPRSSEAGTGHDDAKLAIEAIRASLEESENGHSAMTTEKDQKDNTGMAQVTDLRYWSNPDYTRVAVMLDREAEYEYHRLKKDDSGKLPPRLYLDIKGARLAQGVRDISIGDGLLRMIRVAQYRSDVVRVVLDIDTMKDFKIFPLSDPSRIIIDVKGERKVEISSLNDSIQTLPSTPPEEVNIRKTVASTGPVPVFKPGKIRRIVIDPGHGGHDPGAIGPNGTREKDVVLAMGLKLAKKIREDLRMDVVMTRSTDIFIPLEERTAIANKVNADLFISVHANASLNKSTSGIETYYLNLAKTEKAKQVAARENNTSLEKVGVLQTILFDLMANHKLNDSARLADDVQNALYSGIGKQYQDVRNQGVKQGPFYVLVGATMPSILVETAFLSNEKEESRLKDPEYQDATVAGIVEGIKAYIAGLK